MWKSEFFLAPTIGINLTISSLNKSCCLRKKFLQRNAYHILIILSFIGIIRINQSFGFTFNFNFCGVCLVSYFNKLITMFFAFKVEGFILISCYLFYSSLEAVDLIAISYFFLVCRFCIYIYRTVGNFLFKVSDGHITVCNLTNNNLVCVKGILSSLLICSNSRRYFVDCICVVCLIFNARSFFQSSLSTWFKAIYALLDSSFFCCIFSAYNIRLVCWYQRIYDFLCIVEFFLLIFQKFCNSDPSVIVVNSTLRTACKLIDSYAYLAYCFWVILAVDCIFLIISLYCAAKCVDRCLYLADRLCKLSIVAYARSFLQSVKTVLQAFQVCLSFCIGFFKGICLVNISCLQLVDWSCIFCKFGKIFFFCSCRTGMILICSVSLLNGHDIYINGVKLCLCLCAQCLIDIRMNIVTLQAAIDFLLRFGIKSLDCCNSLTHLYISGMISLSWFYRIRIVWYKTIYLCYKFVVIFCRKLYAGSTFCICGIGFSFIFFNLFADSVVSTFCHCLNICFLVSISYCINSGLSCSKSCCLCFINLLSLSISRRVVCLSVNFLAEFCYFVVNCRFFKSLGIKTILYIFSIRVFIVVSNGCHLSCQWAGFLQ